MGWISVFVDTLMLVPSGLDFVGFYFCEPYFLDLNNLYGASAVIWSEDISALLGMPAMNLLGISNLLGSVVVNLCVISLMGTSWFFHYSCRPVIKSVRFSLQTLCERPLIVAYVDVAQTHVGCGGYWEILNGRVGFRWVTWLLRLRKYLS